ICGGEPPHRPEKCTMKKTMKSTARAFLTAIALAAAASGQQLALHYNQPAEDWQSQALPIGNGRLGAMIFGDARHQHLQLNEISLWTSGGLTSTRRFMGRFTRRMESPTGGSIWRARRNRRWSCATPTISPAPTTAR